MSDCERSETACEVPETPRVKKEKKPKAPKGAKGGKLQLAVDVESLGAPLAGIAKKPKRTRVPTAYNAFVKEHIKSDAIRALPANQRFSAVAALYKSQKKA